MPSYELPEGVERFDPRPARLGAPSNIAPHPNGDYIRVSDLDAIRSQERQRIEEERCESCDDTGIYEEGDEWAPCLECELGRAFAGRLKSHAQETREQTKTEIDLPREVAAARKKAAQQERQRVREALILAVQDEDAILDERLASAVHKVRRAKDPETLDEAVRDLSELVMEIALDSLEERG